MVEREVVLQTVKRMYSSGIDDETVKSTLKDIGLTETEIIGIMNEAKGVKAEEEPAEEEKPAVDADEEIAAKAAGRIKKHLEAERAERELRETTAKIEAAEHQESLGEIHKTVEELRERIATSPAVPAGAVGKIDLIDKRISSLEKEVVEIKAATNALQSLLKKILSTDREILSNISRKK